MRIPGVDLRDLCTHEDARGSLTEVFRETWVENQFVQWNHVRSAGGVLRGVHGHYRHSDYLILLHGSALIGLKDLRRDSEAYGAAALISLTADKQQSLTIPPGVAHGFYFCEPSVMIYAVTHYWAHDDELGCRWDDPGLGIRWPFSTADISDRDAALPGLPEFSAELQERIMAAEKSQCGNSKESAEHAGQRA